MSWLGKRIRRLRPIFYRDIKADFGKHGSKTKCKRKGTELYERGWCENERSNEAYQHERKGEQWDDKAKGYEDWGTGGGS